ncbi:MAG: GNAT family N-acetyltransferase [Spirochaetales bacterium]|nr:GNAT family N-acetyltransferase [Spirochaetales bacterium]
MDFSDLIYRTADSEDFEDLAALRIRAMRPSLEALGRFDPERARIRLLKSFVPKETTLVFDGHETLLGFFMMSERKGGLFLNHFYVDPDFQGQGLGARLMERVKEEAARKGVSLDLEALKESRANAFYLSQGFVKTGESDFDNEYRWSPAT